MKHSNVNAEGQSSESSSELVNSQGCDESKEHKVDKSDVEDEDSEKNSIVEVNVRPLNTQGPESGRKSCPPVIVKKPPSTEDSKNSKQNLINSSTGSASSSSCGSSSANYSFPSMKCGHNGFHKPNFYTNHYHRSFHRSRDIRPRRCVSRSPHRYNYWGNSDYDHYDYDPYSDDEYYGTYGNDYGGGYATTNNNNYHSRKTYYNADHADFSFSKGAYSSYFNKFPNSYNNYGNYGRGRFKMPRQDFGWSNYHSGPGNQHNYYNEDHSYKKSNPPHNSTFHNRGGGFPHRGKDRGYNSSSSLSPRTTKNNIRNNYKYKTPPPSSPNPPKWDRHSPGPPQNPPSYYYPEDATTNGLTVDVGGELGNLEECSTMTTFCSFGIGDGLLTMDIPEGQSKVSGEEPPNGVHLDFVECDKDQNLEGKEGGHVVHFHINPGTTVNFTNSEGEIQKISGPATVRMVSTNSSPPIPLPVQMPPGHVVQQIVDETGTLQHVILSAQPMPLPVCSYGPNGGQGPPQFYNGPPPGGYMTSYQPPPQYSPVMSPPLNSPPPHNYQKGERNGGREKLRQKYYPRGHQPMPHFQQPHPVHIKNNLNTIHHPSPPLSPKKDNMNACKTEEETVNGEGAPMTLQEWLSQIKPPEICSVEAFRASASWCSPDQSLLAKEVSSLLFEVFLNNHVYDTVSSTSLDVVDLKPGTEYKLQLVCLCNGVRGLKTPPKTFCTKATIPDAPQLRMIDRKKQSLAFRWPAPKDNGARITNYCVEIQGGQWATWSQVQNSRTRDFNANKLKPQTSYKVRVNASNQVGASPYSHEISAITAGVAPTQPQPPVLNSCCVDSLSVSWAQRSSDEMFSLEMLDSCNEYGFRPVFHGPETSHTCTSLRRNTEYKFRLCCQNTNGKSPFSEVVSYRTVPDRPLPPPAPVTSGKPSTDKFSLSWQPPFDHGGTKITSYIAQIDKGNGFENVYNGPSLACDVRNLRPGTEYKVRLSAVSSGGQSEWSPCASITTKPVEPGSCKPPKLASKPKANTLQLKWDPPEFDGGSKVTEFHVEMITPNSERKQVFCGRQLECTVASLLPGRPYMFVLRAVNSEGPGGWSEPFDVVSGAGPPDAPRVPHLACKSPHSVHVTWEEPINNGARVENYTVEVAEVCSPNTESSESSSTCGEADVELTFTKVYCGSSLSAEVRNLTPATTFAFRVNASNVAGAGSFSVVSHVTTPAACPAAPSYVSSTVSATELSLHWTEPNCHGDPITHYNIEVADALFNTHSPALEYTLSQLLPETNYKIRVQAVNSVGGSAMSAVHRATTHCLPPSPPRLELVKASFNSLRLKWADGRNTDLLKYSIQMELLNPHNNSMEFYQVYRGTNQTFKVGKLEENTTYRLCICATNEAGTGPLSEPVEFCTTKAPPLPLKAPRVKEGPNGTYCIEWCGVRCPGEDTIVYRLQMLQAGKDQDYSLIYFGGETSYIKSGLSPQTGYYVRVCGVRMSGDKEVVAGAYSSPTLFNTPKIEASNSGQEVENLQKDCAWYELNDQQKAMGILMLFSLLAFVAAYVLSPDSVR